MQSLPKRYEVWEYEHAVSYALCLAGDEEERLRAREEGGQLVLEFEAASWDDAKRRQNEFVSTIRARLPD